jgi:putative thioredoxin
VAGDATRPALEQFIEMLQAATATSSDGPGRARALIDAFRVIDDEDLVGRYRRRMSSLLLV